MPEMALLRDLSVVMVVAAIITLCCHLFKQPVVIGYLLAGAIIGPHTPPFSLIDDPHSIETMAELGLIFLMFAIGLEFNLPKLRKVGMSAALAATLELISMIAIGYGLGKAFGWSRLDSFYLGAILSISSTTIIAKVFTDLKLAKEEFAQVVFGILILEDIFAIVILTVLSGLGASQIEGGMAIRAFGEVLFFVVLFLVGGLALVPRLITWVGRFRSTELLGIVVLGLCLASALLGSRFGFSVALGAFLMGSIIGVSSEIDTIEDWVHPIRDMFSAIFFVATGMLLDPQLLWLYRGPVAIIVLVTIVGKVFSGALGSFLVGFRLNTSFKVGMSLAQIGEFAFVFAALALKDKNAGDHLYPIAVTVSAITTLFTPYLIRNSDRVVGAWMRVLGPQTTARLESYCGWLSTRRDHQIKGSAMLSKYLVRLAVYTVLFIATLSLITYISRHTAGSDTGQAIGWTLGFLICLPLIRAVATYFSHFILITVTEGLVRLHSLKLLERLSIPRFYTLVNGGLMTILALIFLGRAELTFSHKPEYWTLAALSALLIAFIVRHGVNITYERMEEVLDEALGLATSEPLRQAALKTEEGGSVLSESMERVFLHRRDAAVSHSIRSLGLREKSGASLIAVYRRGKIRTNPPPEMILLTNDTLVIIGDKDERSKARRLLRNG